MKIDPEILLIVVSLTAVGATFVVAWRRSNSGRAQASDVAAWLLEKMVVLAVLIIFVTIIFLLFSLKVIS